MSYANPTIISNQYGLKFDFTVLMAVYLKDDPDLFEMAIESVLANTLLPKFFYIVVDGPITENLESVLIKFKHVPLLKIFRLSFNKGLANALNYGLNQVTTQFVLRADADDINMPNRFEVQSKLMASGFDLFGADILEVDKYGNELGVRKTPKSYQSIIKFSKSRNPFNHMTVGYKADLVRGVGGYPNLDLREDYALWVILLSKGIKAINTEDILVNVTAGIDMYRRRGGIRSIKAEFHMQRLLVRYKFKNIFFAMLEFFVKSLIFMLPPSFRGFLYQLVLRSPSK